MRVPLGVAWVTALSGPFADSVCGPWPSKRDKTGAYPRLRGRGMGRFRSVAITVIVLVAALSASDLSGKGKGGGGKRGGGHKPAPHRAAPKVHAAHHSGPKPNRVARKPAPHHAGHPGGKQAHHSAKPKGPGESLQAGREAQRATEKRSGEKRPRQKRPGKKTPAKRTGKPTSILTTGRSRRPASRTPRKKIPARIGGPTRNAGTMIAVSSVAGTRNGIISLTSTTIITGARSIGTGGTTSSITRTPATTARRCPAITTRTTAIPARG